ncbi:hypothetical protein BBP00_00004744 [Phytophthora kernoviae]|uniref:SUN domain-containing protein n=1 Tax=Phytophthora kernoviae TaxID=325452 RepID=A0A3F2RQX9_9STRA|nr:hypothetical protein BBP00_00004744 [Phytophthora kernoviae]
MAEGNAYSRRLRSGGDRQSRLRSESPSSESEDEFETSTRSSSRRYGIYTPEPVQRTLELRSSELEEDEDDYEDEFEDLDDYRGTTYRSTTYRPPQEDEVSVAEAEDIEVEAEETEPEVRRSELKKRAAGAAAFFKRQPEGNTLWQGLVNSPVVKTILKYLRRLWRFVLRNSFMAVNVLWLLAPLCCFVVAITVPQYLTTAIQYVDILSTSVTGRTSDPNTMEKGAMRTVVQEIVDLKLSGMNDQVALLQKTVQSQEREIEALHLLHDSLRHAHNEAQQKFSLVESDSAITVHIEKVVGKHTEELWEKFIGSTSQLQQDLRTTAKQQSVLSTAVKAQEERIDAVQNMVKKTATFSSAEPAHESARGYDTRKDFIEWRESFERELQSEVQHKVQDIEDRLTRVLQEEKRALSSSADALRGLDATDPGILRVIEVAVQAVEIKKTGRVDHAALANGATVIHSERDGLIVKFAQQIIADSVTIDHIPAQIAADFRSALNEFRILGVSGHPLRETVKFIPFGNFSYESNGAASQTFKMTSPVSRRSPIDGMTLEILSNHGHPDFTCLYRFRVHGQPV